MPRRRPTIALLRLGALGDLVLLSALLQALAEAGWRTLLVCEHHYAGLVAALPCLDRPVLFERDRHQGWSGLRALAVEVGPVDTVVDLQNKPRTRLLASWIRARHQRSLQLRTPWQALRSLIGRDPIFTDRHQAERNHEFCIDLVERAYPPRPRLRCEVTRRRQLALVPGARHAAKRWPPERWGQLARNLRERGWPCVVVVGPGEQALLKGIRAEADAALSSTVDGSIAEVIEACASSTLVVAGDTGPAHVAAAVGTPVVSLFGPTSARRWRPLGPGEVLSVPLDCRPCSNHGRDSCPLGHHRCMLDLGVDEVLQACQRQLGAAW